MHNHRCHIGSIQASVADKSAHLTSVGLAYSVLKLRDATMQVGQLIAAVEGIIGKTTKKENDVTQDWASRARSQIEARSVRELPTHVQRPGLWAS